MVTRRTGGTTRATNDPRPSTPFTRRSNARRSSKRGRGLASLAELVPRVYPRDEPPDALLMRILAAWERHMPARVAKSARPFSLVRGTLTVHTTTSAWSQELTLTVDSIRERLAPFVPRNAFHTLRFRVGALPERHLVRPLPRMVVIPLATLPTDVRAALTTIEDPGLRDAIERAALHSLGHRTRSKAGA